MANHKTLSKNVVFYCKAAQALQQIAQRGSVVCSSGDTQNPTGCSPAQPALTDPACARGSD